MGTGTRVGLVGTIRLGSEIIDAALAYEKAHTAWFLSGKDADGRKAATLKQSEERLRHLAKEYAQRLQALIDGENTTNTGKTASPP